MNICPLALQLNFHLASTRQVFEKVQVCSHHKDGPAINSFPRYNLNLLNLSYLMSEFSPRLAAAEAENLTLKSRVSTVDDLERQCRNLREDIAVLTGRRDALRYSSSPLPRAITVCDSNG